WLQKLLTLEQARQQVWEMEDSAYRFYIAAAGQVTDAGIRKLLGDLAAAEKGHSKRASQIDHEVLGEDGRETEKTEAHRQFVLTYVQPGLAGLMDGSVSTLAPVFAAAFATGDTHQTFLVGLAAA